MVRHNRNFGGIKHQALREKVDPIAYMLADELEDCYYGSYVDEDTPRLQDGWKQGNSKPFLTVFDVQPSLPESLALFQALHGLIWHLYTLLFDEVNQQEPVPIPESEYALETDIDSVQHDKRTTARNMIIQIRDDYGLTNQDLQSLRQELITRVKTTLDIDVVLI